MIADTTPPACAVTRLGTNANGQKFMEITVQDSDRGLRSITLTTLVNTSAQVGRYQSGITQVPTTVQVVDHTTNPVVITATRLDSTKAGQVVLQVTDLAGNTTACDPVLTTLTDKHGQTGWQVFKDLNQAENRVRIANDRPGLRRLLVIVNGHKFEVAGLRPSEVRILNVMRAMKPGDHNTIVVRGSGPSDGTADIMIWDGSGMLPPPAPAGAAVHKRGPIQGGADPGVDADDDLLDWLGQP